MGLVVDENYEDRTLLVDYYPIIKQNIRKIVDFINAHQSASTIDHPDGSVSMSKLSEEVLNTLALLREDITNSENDIVTIFEKIALAAAERAAMQAEIDAIPDETVEAITARIVDDLISTDTDKALSARQGKILKASIDAIVASGGGDMLSVDYDEDQDGIIDKAKADEYGNDIAETYATKAEVEGHAQSADETYVTKTEMEEHTHSAEEMYATKAELGEHEHSAADIKSGILSVLNGGTGASTAEMARENLGAAYTFVSTVQTLNTGWTLEDTMYTQTIECANLLSSDTPILDIVTSESLDDNKLFIEAWSHVVRAVANDGNITLYADSVPDVSFSFNVKVVR